jgi:subtilisin family serine protease
MTKDSQGNDTGAGGWADGISEDGDTAHVDDLVGWNFVNNTNNPFDDHGHGTHTAGTIAAVGNNGVGVVGVTWSSEIMSLKFLDNTGNGTDLAAAQAIRYAADHGARVSNNSWGGASNDQTLYDAINYGGSKGEIFVAAAGNSATNTDVTPNYPSAFNLSNIIAVAAIASDGSLASFSNYGPTTVDLGASTCTARCPMATTAT